MHRNVERSLRWNVEEVYGVFRRGELSYEQKPIMIHFEAH